MLACNPSTSFDVFDRWLQPAEENNVTALLDTIYGEHGCYYLASDGHVEIITDRSDWDNLIWEHIDENTISAGPLGKITFEQDGEDLIFRFHKIQGRLIVEDCE